MCIFENILSDMRILKYVLYLVVTFFVSLMIFVSTLPTAYEAKAHVEIPISYDLAYAYVHHLPYWAPLFKPYQGEDVWVTNKKLQAYDDFLAEEFEWFDFENSSSTETQFKFVLDGVPLTSLWHITPTQTGTRLEWKVTGKSSFQQKILQFFLIRDTRKIVDEWLNATLERISEKAKRDFIFQSMEIEGAVTLAAFQGFVFDSITPYKNMDNVVLHLLEKAEKYNDSNIKIQTIQKRFINRYDGLMQVQIYQSNFPKNDTNSVFFQKREPILALKVVMNGKKFKLTDIEKLVQTYFETSDYERKKPFEHIEVSRVNENHTPFSFEWVTEWYIPIRKKFTLRNPSAVDSLLHDEAIPLETESID